MKKEISRSMTPRRRAPEADISAVFSRGDADESRAGATLKAEDENSFVEDIDVDDDYERGVEEVSRRRAWA